MQCWAKCMVVMVRAITTKMWGVKVVATLPCEQVFLVMELEEEVDLWASAKVWQGVAIESEGLHAGGSNLGRNRDMCDELNGSINNTTWLHQVHTPSLLNLLIATKGGKRGPRRNWVGNRHACQWSSQGGEYLCHLGFLHGAIDFWGSIARSWMFKFSKLDTERLVAGMSYRNYRLLEQDMISNLLIS